MTHDFSPAGLERQAAAVQQALATATAANAISALESVLPWLAQLRVDHRGAHAEAIGTILVAWSSKDRGQLTDALGSWRQQVTGEAPDWGRADN